MATVEEALIPLEAGDVLTREEFLRRWEAHPEIKKAELIGGIVYMPSPVTLDHGDYEGHVGYWLGTYALATPGCKESHNATALLLADSPQPDVHLRILAEAGGQSRKQGKYLSGPPEHITEVCRSSAAYDLHPKMDLYEKAGVLEYLAVLLVEREIRWHCLFDGSYVLIEPTADGIWKSSVFPGLWLNGPALLREDRAQMLATLQEGLKTPEHVAFAKKLQVKMSAGK